MAQIINFVCKFKGDIVDVEQWAAQIKSNCGFKHFYFCVDESGVLDQKVIDNRITVLREMPKDDYFFIDVDCMVVDELDPLLLRFGYRTPGDYVVNAIKSPLTKWRLDKLFTYWFKPQHGVYTFSELHVNSQIFSPPENSIIIFFDRIVKPKDQYFWRQCTWAKAYYNASLD